MTTATDNRGSKTRAVPEALLTRAEVAAWLRVEPKEVPRLGVPELDFGPKTKRYERQAVEQWLDRRRPKR